MNPTDKPTPTVEDPADARNLPWTILDRAIARYEETRANLLRDDPLAGLDPRLPLWHELSVAIAVEASSDLLRALIATSPGFGNRPVHHAERFPWPTRGVRSGDRIYLAAADPDRAGEPGGYDRSALMKLVVFDRGDDLDCSPAVLADVILPGPIRPAPEVPPDPAPPAWLATLIKAAEDLGEAEAMRRIFDAPRQPAA